MRQRDVAIVGLVALFLYLPFRAIQYDSNGLVEAWTIQVGTLFHKNHLLYRPLGYLLYRGLQYAGFQGKPIAVLQILNAVCGAIGVALSYTVFKRYTNDRTAAAFGSFWLGTSLVYWMFSTDVAYITLAGMFALAALSAESIIVMALFASLSVLTWQASLFVVPVCLIFMWKERRPPRQMVVFIATVVVLIGISYGSVAAVTGDVRTPSQFWTWFGSYGEGTPLPLWGTWSADRIGSGVMSGLGSVIPIRLGVWPNRISKSVQWGRILVDIAFLGFLLLMTFAASKHQWKSVWFLAGYLAFVPFILWWDPFEPKWFFIPNVFLAGFLASNLQPWLHRKFFGLIIIGSAVVIAAANFITTIRPRHNLLGIDRTIASCVSDHMQTQDAFIAAQWGWPDTLAYLHDRTTINLINESADGRTKEQMLSNVKRFIVSTQETGGSVYTLKPRQYTEDHLKWLNQQTGLTLEDFRIFDGEAAFECSGRTIQKIPRL